MTLFRGILIVITIAMFTFTAAVVANHGLTLIPQFLQPVLAVTWQGQFNVDFTFYLILSGIWMAWRGGFTGGSIALGILAPPLGMLFFAPYLIFLVSQSGGDARRLLLGVRAGDS